MQILSSQDLIPSEIYIVGYQALQNFIQRGMILDPAKIYSDGMILHKYLLTVFLAM
jgi:hypothetical protein